MVMTIEQRDELLKNDKGILCDLLLEMLDSLEGGDIIEDATSDYEAGILHTITTLIQALLESRLSALEFEQEWAKTEARLDNMEE